MDVRVRGLLITQQRELLRRAAGARYAAALARVPSEVREEYEGAGVLSWCRQTTVRSVTAAVAGELARDPVELACHVVEQSTRGALRGPWAVLIGMMKDDDAIVRRASILFEKAFDAGTLRATQIDERAWSVLLEGWPAPHVMDIESVAAGIATLLDVLGRPCKVTSGRRGATIEYTVRLTDARPS